MKPLLVLTLMLLGLSQWGRPITDPDLGWQLLGGDWILAHGNLPPFDFINSFNANWHNYHWLAQILLSSIYGFSGFLGLKIAFGVSMAVLGLLVVFTAYASAPKRPVMPVILLLSLGAFFYLNSISSIRPQMWALALIGCAQLLLLRKKTPLELLSLFALTVLIANFHVYWIFIPALWVFHRIIPLLIQRKIQIQFHLFGLLVLLGAGLCTPYFLNNYTLLFEYLHIAPILRQQIGEFQFGLTYSWGFFLLWLTTALIFATHSSRKYIAEHTGPYFAGLSGLILGALSVKFSAFTALFCLPHLSFVLHQRLSRFPSLTSQARWQQHFLSAACLLTGFVAFSRFPKASTITSEPVLSSKYAASICASLPQLGLIPSAGRSHVLLATNFNQGGWCRWAVAQEAPHFDVRVSTDGRTQYVPPSHYEQSFALYSASTSSPTDWQKTIAQWQPDAILTSKKAPLYPKLLHTPNFALIKEDPFFAIFKPILPK